VNVKASSRVTYLRSMPSLSHELTNSVYSRIKQNDIPTFETYLPLIPDGNNIPLTLQYDRFITLLLQLGQNNWQPPRVPPAPGLAGLPLCFYDFLQPRCYSVVSASAATYQPTTNLRH
jgi:hypothetical protein